MPKKPSTPSPKPPAGMWERLTNRRPTTFIPGYDAIAPFDYPRPDREAVWGELQAEIDDLAARKAFDEAHPFLIDDLLQGRIDHWRRIVAAHRAERLSILEALEAQGIWHQSRLRRRLVGVRRDHWQAVSTQGTTWSSLTGLPSELPAASATPVPAPAATEPVHAPETSPAAQAEPWASDGVTPLHRAS